MGETEKTYIEVMAEQWGVPLDLMRVASELWDGIFEGDSVADKGVIARALMAERERCKVIAHREAHRHGEGAAAAACLEIALAIIKSVEG